MKRAVVLTLLIFVSGVLAGGVTVAQDDIDLDEEGIEDAVDDAVDEITFEIATVNGKDADQVNEIEFHRGSTPSVQLDGADLAESQYRVAIDGTEHFVDPDGEISIAGDLPKEGVQTLEVIRYERGSPGYTVETEVEITDTEWEPDGPDFGSEPDDFEIATVNGEDAGQVNDIEFHHDATVELELDGVDAGDHLFEIEIDGTDHLLAEDGTISYQTALPDEGKHTLTVTKQFRGDPATSAETQVEVTDSDWEPEIPDPDDRDFGSDDADQDMDRPHPEDRAGPDSEPDIDPGDHDVEFVAINGQPVEEGVGIEVDSLDDTVDMELRLSGASTVPVPLTLNHRDGSHGLSSTGDDTFEPSDGEMMVGSPGASEFRIGVYTDTDREEFHEWDTVTVEYVESDDYEGGGIVRSVTERIFGDDEPAGVDETPAEGDDDGIVGELIEGLFG